MSKRKYEEVKGYWVYSIKIPSINKYYIGVSKQKCYRRWNKAGYKGKSLEPYLDEWDSMIKTVLVDNLTKEQSYQYEDAIIRGLQMNNLTINERRSGLIASDENVYKREYYENNSEYRECNKQRAKQWRLNNPEYSKQRYANDAEYREQQKQRAKQNKLKKKLECEQQQTSVH